MIQLHDCCTLPSSRQIFPNNIPDSMLYIDTVDMAEIYELFSCLL